MSQDVIDWLFELLAALGQVGLDDYLVLKRCAHYYA